MIPIPPLWYAIGALVLSLGATAALQTYRLSNAKQATAEVRLELQTLRTNAAEDMSIALAKVRAVEAGNLKTMQEVTKSHEKRLIALRKHYAALPAVGLRLNGPTPAAPADALSSLSPDSGGTPQGPPDYGLATRCAETTLQLIDLRDAIRRIQKP